jgi:hypothetical protein
MLERGEEEVQQGLGVGACLCVTAVISCAGMRMRAEREADSPATLTGTFDTRACAWR